MASGKAGVHVIQLKPIVVQEKLQQGCKFVKWDDDSTIGTHVTLCIDSKGFFLYWKDANNEIEFLEISSIRDTRTGRHARVPKEGKLRDSCNIGSPEIPVEDKTFTVVYGPDFVNTSFINFVASNPKDALEWTDSVFKMAYNLLALNASPYTLLAKAHTKIQLMVDREGQIPVRNFIKQYAQNKDDKKRVEKALDFTNIPTGKSSSFDPDKFPLETFLQFYKHLVVRSEVDKIFDRLISAGDLSENSNDNHPRLMTVDQFVDFLNKEQRDPRLNEILYPYADRAKGIELISQYEPNKDNIEKDCISADGFLRYLMSDDNAIVAPEKFDHNQDMDQPLNHYFINSSHNTYLTGHQFTGKASVEMYRQCLLAGCRCIELDCWNGSNSEEPIITHGYTVVNDIPCKDVLEAIAETAFKTSCYPVILSFENHCSTRQQAKIAQYCRKFFGDMLLTEPLSSHPLKPGVNLPSPNLLMRKILIKNKKKKTKKKKQRGTNLTSTATTSNLTSTPGDVPGSSGPSVRVDTAATMTPSGDTSSTIAGSLSSSGLPSSTPERRATLQTNNSDESNTLEREDSSQIADNDDSIGGQDRSPGTGLATNNQTAVTSSCDMDDNESDDSLEDDDAGPPSEAGGAASGSSVGEQLEGEVHKEAEASDAMSALVIYIQPVNFVSFEHSEKRNRSYEIISIGETSATNSLKTRPVDFVNHNKIQLSRIYPKGPRVDSSNYMPQVFWNAGCQMVALNFQTLDIGMQLNVGIFEYNGRSGYLLKPDFMRRMDRKFDPFTESTVDGIIAGTVSVQIISGQFLTDKRTGTYVEVDMFGLPADTIRRRRTKTVPNNGVNPIYDDDPFVFKKVVLPDLACLRIAAYEEGGKFIGHRILSVVGLRPGYRHLALRNESGQPLTLPTLFVHITVKDYVPEGFSELADALANPIAYQSMAEKRAKQLEALTDDEHGETCGDVKPGTSEKGANTNFGLNNASTVAAKVTITSDSSERITNSTDDRRTSSGLIGSSSSKHESMNGTVSVTSSRIATTSSSVTSSLASQVISSPAHPSAVPQLIRQDTTSLRKNQSVRSLSDETAPERSVYLLESEACNLEAEQLESLKNHKDVLKIVTKLEKELAETKKKFEKSRSEVVNSHQNQHKTMMGSSQSKQRSVVLNIFRKSSSSTDARSKRLSEVDVSSPETMERLQESHRTCARVLCDVTLAQFNSEKSLLDKYHTRYYTALEGAMQTSQSNQEKQMQKLHDTDVNRVQRRVDAQIKEDVNNLGKKYKDKNELSRVKREQHQRIIDAAVAERQRLGDLLDQRKAELKKRHKLVKSDLIEDERKAKEKIDREYQSKCESLTTELESTPSLKFIENWKSK